MMLLPSLALALSLAAAPARGAEGRSHDEERASDAAEEERARAAPPAESAPAPAEAIQDPSGAAAPGPAAPAARLGDQAQPAASEPAPTRSLSMDLGLAATVLGGLAFPKVPLSGSPDNSWHAPGLGAAFQLHGDFTAMDLDWRVGGRGALPGYMGLYGTVGIRKEMGPWKAPRLVARGAGGLELMLASAGGATYLVPVFLAEAEAAVEYMVVPATLGLGAGLALDVRYGLPLGLGFNLGGFLRANLWF